MTKRKTSRRKRSNSTKYSSDIGQTQKPRMPYISSFENPFSGLSESEIKEVISEVRDKAIQSIKDSTLALYKIIKTNDPLIILAIISYYTLNVGLGEKEVQSRGYFEGFGQPHVELFQALILKIKKNEWGSKLGSPGTTQETLDNLNILVSSFSFVRMNSNSSELTEMEKEIIEFQESIRNHTTYIRNCGYFSQVKRLILELYSPFEITVKSKYGFSIKDAVSVFDQLVLLSEKRMNDRVKFLRNLMKMHKKNDLVKKYYDAKGYSSEELNLFLRSPIFLESDQKNLFHYILAFEDQNIAEIYFFLEEDLAEICNLDVGTVKSIFKHFSSLPGDLEACEIESLFLDNPVWKKPITQVNGKYFCSIPQMFFSNSIPILDSLIETVDKSKLSTRRAKFLESKIEEIVKGRFPELLTLPNLKWRDHGKDYETDLITFIDSYAIIIEAKSQKITPSALRGGRDRIKRHIEELIIAPSLQSKRLEERLKELISNPNLNDELRNKLPVDLNKIHKIIRISVSLEDFATMQSNISRFKLPDWIPESFVPCPTLNLADFETVFDILEHPVQILHYFERRSELELDENVEIIGDELDYLGFYLSTLFSQGQIQETGKDFLVLSTMSKAIDDYYTLKDAGEKVQKPTIEFNDLFKQIFLKLENRSVHRWAEFGVALSRFSPKEQDKITDFIEKLKVQVANNWYSKDLKNMLIYAPPKGSEYGLAYILYNHETFHRRKEFIESAAAQVLEQAHVKYGLVIVKNIDLEEVAYDYIAICKSL
ncbi:hypothetical protein LEP1GSC020_1457 [Leptospira interrogans serovar Grippotyphosa str. 2006006986]|nr:hypothetical protein [Leptospira interrogans]EKO85233.1 hypothetical protein LEP1GSC009_0015 [Leptospira interrogans serovar Grippotyphosa str. Andaman]EKP85515.1 hypothetical protein LEP1GSC020_1457 [Leptospira interrogans serovar Grippotyphosa str. 2006006986]